MVDLVLALVLISVILLAVTVAFFIATYFIRPADEEEKRGGRGDLEKGILSCRFVVGEENVVKKYSWNEIKQLTMDFKAPVIGRGGYSIVYLGKLPDSTLVAVKVHQESERLHQAFKQELEVLVRVRHEHIVRLIGFCEEKEEGAVVFEYIPNGTLHEKLHGVDEIDTTTTSILTWSQRMTIAYTLASSLEYLHDQCDPQIIHGDVKPSNILLSNSLVTKICDFGSAKIGFSSSISPVTTRNTRQLRNALIGSPGYSDPHYLRTGMTSKKSDVYSFGVVVMELVTGLEPFNEEKGHVLSADMAGIVVDEKLGSEFDVAERDVVAEVVRRCVGVQPSLRPSMAEIVRIFQDKFQNSIFAVDGKQLL